MGFSSASFKFDLTMILARVKAMEMKQTQRALSTKLEASVKYLKEEQRHG